MLTLLVILICGIASKISGAQLCFVNVELCYELVLRPTCNHGKKIKALVVNYCHNPNSTSTQLKSWV